MCVHSAGELSEEVVALDESDARDVRSDHFEGRQHLHSWEHEIEDKVHRSLRKPLPVCVYVLNISVYIDSA